MNQEIAYNIISLQNQVKALKDENQNLQQIAKDLKEKAISKELLETLYPNNLLFKNINFNKKGELCWIMNNQFNIVHIKNIKKENIVLFIMKII